jgi:hypothetical protein
VLFASTNLDAPPAGPAVWAAPGLWLAFSRNR